jgi:hypothetical protein
MDMPKVESTLELIFIKALINGIDNYPRWEWLYTLHDRTLFKVK